MIMLVTLSKYEAILLAVNTAVFTPPHTSAAVVGLELTKVSTTPVNCCAASRNVYSRGATHLLARPLLFSSISATNARTLEAFGFVLLAWYCCFCSLVSMFSKLISACFSGAVGSAACDFGRSETARAMVVRQSSLMMIIELQSDC